MTPPIGRVSSAVPFVPAQRPAPRATQRTLPPPTRTLPPPTPTAAMRRRTAPPRHADGRWPRAAIALVAIVAAASALAAVVLATTP